MPITPQSQVSYKPGNMSEEAEFALTELYAEINALHHALGMDQGSKPKEEIRDLTMRLDAVEETIADLQIAQLTNEANITKMQEAIQELSSKLDTEDVADIDTDYLETINNKLF